MVAIVTFLGATGAVLFLFFIISFLLFKRKRKNDKKSLQKNLFSLLASTSNDYSFFNLIGLFNVYPDEIKNALNHLTSKGLVEKHNDTFRVTEFGKTLYDGFIKDKKDGFENII
jgi:predicted transcriptional regulator